jgi:hypothetical protein
VKFVVISLLRGMEPITDLGFYGDRNIADAGAPPASHRPIAPTKLPETSIFKSNPNTEQAISAPAIAPSLG